MTYTNIHVNVITNIERKIGSFAGLDYSEYLTFKLPIIDSSKRINGTKMYRKTGIFTK